MDKKQPVRMCIACRTGKEKQALLRIVREAHDAGFRMDETGKIQGRGAYICANKACIQKAKKIFPKAMRCKMDDALYQTLLKVVEKNE